MRQFETPMLEAFEQQQISTWLPQENFEAIRPPVHEAEKMT